MKQEQQYIWIDEYGNKCYYKDRKMTIYHRLDGPAVEGANGYKAWYVDDKLHRLDGPAIEGTNRYKEWYVDGKRHRLDGPAVIWSNGDKAWYVDGKCHRLDGPAIEWADGYKSWYVDGKLLTEEEFNALTASPLELTLEQITAKYGVNVSKLKIKK